MRKHRMRLGAVVLAIALVVAGCGRGYDSEIEQLPGPATLRLLVGSGTTAEARVLHEQTREWAERTGNEVEIVRAAELDQQLGQAFAGGTPPDLFYLAPGAFARFAGNGSLHPYGDGLRNAAALYPNLEEIFTRDGQLYCAPKDFSTLALLIDTDAWREAGLTDADIPRDWDQLAQVAQRLTTPERKGLVLDDSADRVGAFMKQAGGWHVDEKGMPTIDSPQNLRALRYLQSLLQSGSTAFSSAVDAGWAGEALGEGTAAMVIEGTWVSGALASDYPDRRWRAVELPAGPAGKATLSFTNCWGIPMRTPYRQQAQDLVDFLMAREQQEQVAREVGVIPANQEALPALTEGRPEMEGFAAGAAYAQGEVTTKGWDSVEKDFDSRLLGLASGDDPAKILREVQRNAEQTLKG
ncbi:sugar ABC transporter substrate-binding protein [Saccharopolyspora rectivirgula]|jgi:multiple sugar transport system substrate-binding protein|uniref:Sugar ABC transporter substrate-binding protein n=1 Tax=Saccharopolyspora rectivirgula TaxID=28042 RepID=A0A073BCY5_9PSEU|nr:extracellular solute-binding protein [Saccharopolyspora rectivirgula]KEI45599.1 sugar ABC transporter substrate-binding protein [Saccharopolyspora rectivirgula]